MVICKFTRGYPENHDFRICQVCFVLIYLADMHMWRNWNGVPIWKGHAHPCPPRMDRTLAAEEQYRQQDRGWSLKRGHHDLKGVVTIRESSTNGRTVQVSEGKKIYFFQITLKKLVKYDIYFSQIDVTGYYHHHISTASRKGRNLWDVKGRHGTLLGTVPVVSRCFTLW